MKSDSQVNDYYESVLLVNHIKRNLWSPALEWMTLMSKWITNAYESFENVVVSWLHEPRIVIMFCCTKGLRNQLDRLDLNMSVCVIKDLSVECLKKRYEWNIHPSSKPFVLFRVSGGWSLSQLLRPQATDTLDRWPVHYRAHAHSHSY